MGNSPSTGRCALSEIGSWSLQNSQQLLAHLEAFAKSDEGRWQPFVAPFPPDATGDELQSVQLVVAAPAGIETLPLTQGSVQDVQLLIDELDQAISHREQKQLLEPAVMPLQAEAVEQLIPDWLFTFGSGLQPFEETGQPIPFHRDGGQTSHWFAVVGTEDRHQKPFELRYFRALELGDGTLKSDSYPVMPLTDDDRTAVWPLPALEMELKRGDLFMAQQLAHDVAEVYDQPFPDPFDLTALDPRPEYYFGYGVGPHQRPSLEAVKTWMDGSERRFDTFTIAEYDDYEDANELEDELETLQREAGLEAALSLAEDMASAGRYLDPFRSDPRVFFRDDAPADPFTTNLQRVISPAQLADMDTEPIGPIAFTVDDRYGQFAAEAAREREANAALEGSAWFEATFEKSETELLQPVNDSVNYAVLVQETDPWTRELMVEKYWKEPGGYLGIQSVTLDTWDSDDDKGREQAEQARKVLLEVHDQRGLEAMMHKAELMAVQNDWLDGDRVDPRLFTQGPPDRFETLAQRLEDEINPYWNTDGEKIEDPAPQPEVENPYWRLDPIPVNDPNGEPLGHALHMVVYPGVEHDPAAVGSPTMAADEPFRMLEMAHFEKPEAADNFGKDFNGYLIPGLLEGPELAVEVARLEGLPAEWKTLEGDDLKAYQNAELTLTRDPADWHPYNPNAERDARIAVGGLYTDSIQQVTRLNERDDESKVEPVSLDFDL